MKFSAILLGAALYLVSSTEAGITTNTPFKSVTWNGGDNVKVVWVDDAKAPTLEAIGITTVDLMAGDATKQVLVSNIGKVEATAGEIPYTVPKNVGPAGDFYFIKYTAGTYSAFSGSFSIANVDGKIAGFDPKALGDPKAKAATPPAENTPKTGDAKTGGAKDAKTLNTGDAASPAASPATPAAPTANAAAQSASPSPIANNAANLLPGFAGVATAAVALAINYLY